MMSGRNKCVNVNVAILGGKKLKAAEINVADRIMPSP